MIFASDGIPPDTAWRLEAEAIVCALLPWVRRARLPARGIESGLVSGVAPRVTRLRADHISPGYVICGDVPRPQPVFKFLAAGVASADPVLGTLGVGAGLQIAKAFWNFKMSRSARVPIALFQHCGRQGMPVYFGYAAREGAQVFPSDEVLNVREGIAHHCAGDTAGRVPDLAALLRDYLGLLWQASGCSGIGDMRTHWAAEESTGFRAVLAGRYPLEDVAEIDAIAQAAGMIEIQRDGPGDARTGLRPAGAIWYLADKRIAGEELIAGADGKHGDTFKLGDVGDNAQVMLGSPGGSQSRSQDQYNAGETGAQGPGSHGTVQADWLAAGQQSQPRTVGAEPANADTSRELLAEGRRIARSMVLPGQSPHAAGISGEEDLLAFVREMVGKFRLWVEGKGGWKVFWEGKPGEGQVVSESKMQLLFLGVLDEYFKTAGLRLDREVETGCGPVDFTVTGDQRVRVLIEMKRLSNTDFWHGLRTQTPAYMQAQEATSAIFLAVRDLDTPAARKRWETLEEEAAGVRATTGLGIEVECIDVLPKPSASKA